MSKRLFVKILASIMGLAGLVLIIFAIYPIVSYEIEAKRRFPELISPLVDIETEIQFGRLDSTRASNWFIGDTSFEGGGSASYTISIPVLKIDNATVTLGGEDLSKSLIQYPGRLFREVSATR